MPKQNTLIQPRTLKGFRDFVPAAMIPREWLIDTAKRVYRSYGFSPIDTPALELTEILLGKGGAETDKQMYRFTDGGGRDVGMRFDLTVPFARFAAQHIGALGVPFKRYQVGPVWRGENTQRGRYREFVQCDFDTIGDASAAVDTEAALVIHDLFRALGFERFTIRINDRRVLSGLLEVLGLSARQSDVLRALDKLGKIGRDKVAAELESAAGAGPREIEAVLKFAGLDGSREEVLAEAEELVANSEIGREGIAGLRTLFAGVEAAGAERDRFRVDPSIARGLDYYTGTVFETFLDDLPGIGSCCSGGRYDDLAGLYTKESLPGVGASLGVDRLLAAMEELAMLEDSSAPCDAFVPMLEKDRDADYLALAADLRRAGVGALMYPEPRKLGAQLKYATRRGFRYAVIAGGREFEAGTVQVKDLDEGTSVEVARGDVRRAISASATAGT